MAESCFGTGWALSSPDRDFVPLGFKYVVWEYLSLRGSALYVVSFCANVIFLLGLMVLIVRLSSRIAESFVACQASLRVGWMRV